MKRGKLKILGYSLLAVVIIAAGAIAYAYKQLQPQNHFKTVPVVNSSNTKDSQTSEQQSKVQNSTFNMLLIGSDQRKGQRLDILIL
ncbi:hypothetical protein ACFQDF_08970 [Ectobacillus funiculus]